MIYDKNHFAAAHARMRQAPLELTDADLAQLAIIDPGLEARARAALRDAQLAIVHKHMPALQTKAANQRIGRGDRSRANTWQRSRKNSGRSCSRRSPRTFCRCGKR